MIDMMGLTSPALTLFPFVFIRGFKAVDVIMSIMLILSKHYPCRP
jgi:hypothetical protein